MDSLTQITLGAACGELVLGKKIGNRAMLWGAIGGTIPDLDILGNFFMSEMDALAFHRGISHSFFFAVTTPFFFGWLTYQLYQSGLYKRKVYKFPASIIWSFLLIILGFVINYIPVVVSGGLNYTTLVLSTLGIGWIFYRLWKDYVTSPLEEIQVSYKEWILLFFWSIFTHPILDAFTAYGTQLFQPFSDYRVAFNTISVVDPIYTFPFLLCLIIGANIQRKKKLRFRLTVLGIILSSAYLLWTVQHRQHINQVFTLSLGKQNVDYQRLRITPTIFNNMLWQGVVETDTGFYFGLYSRFDKIPEVSFPDPIAKNHELLMPYADDENVQLLQWFTEGYYGVAKREDGKYILYDMRFGTVDEGNIKPEDFVFKFLLTPTNSGLDATQLPRREDGSVPGAFSKLWKRIRGN